MILCDTNVIIEALKKNPVVIQTLEKIGLQIPDALIAATSINRDLQLYTGNTKDFIYIENISLWSI